MENKQTIGIDLGGTNVRLGLVENGEIQNLISKKIPSQESQEIVLNEIIISLSEIINENVKSIGIGVPSIVDIKKGIVYEVHNIPSWKEVHLKYILENKFNIPTYIDNDVNCFVLGEKYFGKGVTYNNIVGLALGTGLGGGIIIDGKLYSGKNGGAGEFGLMNYKNKNYEYYCSGQFFRKVHGVKGEELLEQAEQGDNAAIQIFDEFGEHIGNLINSIMYGLNPELFLLGGSASKAYSFFEKNMFNVIKSHEFKTQLSDIKIERSNLKYAAVLGASVLCKI
ncbi:MAG: ROK family protein [Ignavibacteriae bacterium]|nr:ROK family protein [Ignavibacteriota bacterium]